jgi:pimeloyl-ACP methyl ester carboxylesterase
MKQVLSVLSIVIVFTGCSLLKKENFRPSQLQPGIYDGTLGNMPIIVTLQKSSDNIFSGYFIPVRNQQVEKKNVFQINWTEKGAYFSISGESSKIKISQILDQLTIRLKLPESIASTFHIKRKTTISLKKRKEQVPPVANDRYIAPCFDQWREIDNITYGKARGYWTKNQDVTKPYIYLVTSGLFKMIWGDDEQELQMNFYEPVGDTLAARPLVLLIHGGAFYIGYKECKTITTFAHDLAQRGFAVAAIDYRMGFKVTADEVERSGYKATQDAHAALRYLAHNAEFYRILSNEILVAGSSAGAITALNLAFLDEEERPQSTIGNKKRDDLGFIDASGNPYRDTFKIKGVVNMWGAVTDTSMIDKDEKIPVLSIHGTQDKIVPYGYDYPFNELPIGMNRLMLNKIYGSSMINRRLSNLKIPNKLVSLKDANHEPIVDEEQNLTPLFDTVRNEMYNFLGNLCAPQIGEDIRYHISTASSEIRPYTPTVENGELIAVIPTGGVLIDGNTTAPQIIWYSDSPEYAVDVYAKNKFGSVVKKHIPVKVPGSTK